MFVELGSDLGSLTGDRQGTQCASGGVQASIERGQCCGEHDDLHDVAGVGHADPREEGDERRLGGRVGGPRQDEGHEDDRADVEHEDTQDH